MYELRKNTLNTFFSKAAFFDLDHTLINKNSSFLFGKFLYINNKIPLFSLFRLAIAYCFCKIGVYTLNQLHHYSFDSFFKGKDCAEIEELSRKFLDLHFESLKNIQITSLFDLFKKDHLVVILSSSPDFLVRLFAEKLGAHSYCGTSYTYNDQNQFSGLNEIFEGIQKAEYVKKISSSFSIQLENLSAYSDSHLDIPFLESVGNPIAVNPTRLLRKYSILKSWKIIE